MPFVDAKLTVPVSNAERDAIKSGLGQAVSVFGKGESYLMVGIDDDYSLWLGGNKLARGAFVSVSLIGDMSDDKYGQSALLGKTHDPHRRLAHLAYAARRGVAVAA